MKVGWKTVMKQQKLVSKGIDTVMYNNNQISVFQAENKFWSVRECGPLWVPAKNMTVVIDSASWIVYKALIEWEPSGIECILECNLFSHSSDDSKQLESGSGGRDWTGSWRGSSKYGCKYPAWSGIKY